MAIEIIRHMEWVETTTYTLDFPRRGLQGRSWSFPCDEKGNVKVSELQPPGLQTWQELQARMDQIKAGTDHECEPPRLRPFTNRYKEPAVGRCVCGRKVDLGGFTNYCECKKLYNSAGQELVPEDQWEEPWDDE